MPSKTHTKPPRPRHEPCRHEWRIEGAHTGLPFNTPELRRECRNCGQIESADQDDYRAPVDDEPGSIFDPR